MSNPSFVLQADSRSAACEALAAHQRLNESIREVFAPAVVRPRHFNVDGSQRRGEPYSVVTLGSSQAYWRDAFFVEAWGVDDCTFLSGVSVTYIDSAV